MALTFDDTQSAVLLTLLGLPEDTDDADLVVETVRDAILPTPVVTDDAAPSAVAAAAKRHGLELLDHDANDALKRDAAEGRRLVAAAAAAKVEAAVDDAIDKGKITPGRRKHWVSLLANDAGMVDVLASIPNETAVPLSEIGHSAAESDTQLTPDGVPQWFY
jgi:hypothetical protein